MAARTFTVNQLYADHLPETHRTVLSDKSVEEVELPGMVEVGVIIDGAKIPLARLKSGGVFKKIARAKQDASSAPPQSGS